VASGAWVSKVEHRAATEHVLRPGEALRARAGAGDAGGTRGGSGGGGATWEKQGRPARGRGRRRARRGRTRGSPLSGFGAVGHGTWSEQRRRGSAEKKQRRPGLEEQEGD
jgi:hypothetical protein